MSAGAKEHFAPRRILFSDVFIRKKITRQRIKGKKLTADTLGALLHPHRTNCFPLTDNKFQRFFSQLKRSVRFVLSHLASRSDVHVYPTGRVHAAHKSMDSPRRLPGLDSSVCFLFSIFFFFFNYFLLSPLSIHFGYHLFQPSCPPWSFDDVEKYSTALFITAPRGFSIAREDSPSKTAPVTFRRLRAPSPRRDCRVRSSSER